MNSMVAFQLRSSAFVEGDMMPEKYSCKGLNISPPLEIRGVPEEATSLALIMRDPDAPQGDFMHWLAWNIRSDIASLEEGHLPDDAFQGTNSYGKVAYSGPCPPPRSTHRYVFDLYALDMELDLHEGASREELEEALENHVVAKTELSGVFGVD